jgi:3-dehydroquinate synthase
MQHRLDRKSALVAIGGGAVGDAVSFAASLYMRGIAVIQVPTTLLAMVDSSVGGKTAINFGAVKNLIGSFQQPDAVCIDPAFLSTLPLREYTSGIAEIIKHACIHDQSLVPLLLEQRLHECDSAILCDVIARSITTKKEVVEQDPTEQHIRKILNFGHTVGHALERCSHDTKEPLLHGEAVAQGMLIESLIAMKLKREAREVLDTLVRLYRFQGISTDIASLDEEKLMGAMLLDKKNQSGVLRFSLSFAVGSCLFDQEVPRDLVLHAYRDAVANTGLLF